MDHIAVTCRHSEYRLVPGLRYVVVCVYGVECCCVLVWRISSAMRERKVDFCQPYLTVSVLRHIAMHNVCV